MGVMLFADRWLSICMIRAFENRAVWMSADRAGTADNAVIVCRQHPLLNVRVRVCVCACEVRLEMDRAICPVIGDGMSGRLNSRMFSPAGRRDWREAREDGGQQEWVKAVFCPTLQN